MLLPLLALAASPLALASSLYARQTGAYPPALQKGPAPKQEWVGTYNAAKAAGKIPSFPPATLVGGNPTYPSGTNTGENGVCSWSVSHCFGDNDISDAPDGMYAIAFDDGPLPSSIKLYNFLKQQNQTATHFLIGTNIVNNPDAFKLALSIGGHLAVHTWSHPYMSTLTDMQVLGELGWTAQAIYDQSGGLVPKYWRPPYGDTDNRVRAIAEEVFGLTLVAWNRDSNDWCLNSGPGACPSYGPQSQADLESELRGWMVGSKSPGSCGLEHESGDKTVGAFIHTYPGIKQHGWDARCVPDLFGADWYQNAARNGTAVPVPAASAIGHGPVSLVVSASSSSVVLNSMLAASSATASVTTSRMSTASAITTSSSSPASAAAQSAKTKATSGSPADAVLSSGAALVAAALALLA
ncbi:chitin deacetylase, carbohydrate esterase family 4 protein [Rhodotorula toruloides]|uniref:chitin deacetylase n=1 Tax=Rhodotorula toruloides TaxID=5286 RepID=A0A511KNG4_RHOTO|nr:chitin deacetylase, carbohydrate esterase family 4 protein [Rhodotorula toruloides]